MATSSLVSSPEGIFSLQGGARGTITQRMSALGERMESSIAASKQWQRQQARNVLLQVGGDRTQAAEILGIDLKSLFRLLAE